MDYSRLNDLETNRMVGDIIFKGLWASKPEASGNNAGKWYYGNAGTAFEPLSHLPDYCNDPNASWLIIEKYRIFTLDQLAEWCMDVKGVSPIFDARPFRAAMIIFLLMQETNNAQPTSTPSIPRRKHRAGFNVHRVGSTQVQRIQKTTGKRYARQADAAHAKECTLEGVTRTQVMQLKEGVIRA